jgi:hypothetical protein
MRPFFPETTALADPLARANPSAIIANTITTAIDRLAVTPADGVPEAEGLRVIRTPSE